MVLFMETTSPRTARPDVAKLLAHPRVGRVATLDFDHGVTVALVQPVTGVEICASEVKAEIAAEPRTLVGVVAALPLDAASNDEFLRLPFRTGIAIPYELE